MKLPTCKIFPISSICGWKRIRAVIVLDQGKYFVLKLSTLRSSLAQVRRFAPNLDMMDSNLITKFDIN